MTVGPMIGGTRSLSNSSHTHFRGVSPGRRERVLTRTCGFRGPYPRMGIAPRIHRRNCRTFIAASSRLVRLANVAGSRGKAGCCVAGGS